MAYELRWYDPANDIRETIEADDARIGESGGLTLLLRVSQETPGGVAWIKEEPVLLVAPGRWIHAKKIP